MTRVAIGIHVHAEPARLLRTIESVRETTRHLAAELILLPDGPDAETAAALRSLSDVPQLATPSALGPPACFNRLAASTTSNGIVLLESGTTVGPGWLDWLLAATETDPRNGLAGPSTNVAWNEQGVAPACRDTAAEIARTAAELARRYGSAWRSLEPLHSLSDFCYVVRRDVIDAIGGADERYGLGPCWEMEYNARAARAGFRDVWACAAFVHRAPFTARRAREERLRFETSKRLYQDSLCALRLRGARVDYESHCRGASCEHFAPPALMRGRRPLEQGGVGAPALPMVSCIMPTRDRGEFVLQAVRYFHRQDYAGDRELIIVDDADGDDLSEALGSDPMIHYARVPRGWSIGAKRNHACTLARGDIIAHWDDDDWYAPGRLAAQIAPLAAGEAEISALRTGAFFSLHDWTFWRCSPDVHRRMFVLDVHGGTLVYRRGVWERLARFPDASLAEDAAFLREAVRSGARLRAFPGDALFVYLRHGRNAWGFDCGRHCDPAGWTRVEEPPFSPDDRAFYAARSAATSAPSTTPMQPDRTPGVTVPGGMPLVSCIMPTADRRAFVPLALRYFERQDYPNRELIVIDDGGDSVADLMPADPRIRYVRLEGRRTIGAKRNLACELAHGDIIVHWDDDDWMAARRLRYQVGALLDDPTAEACGLDVLYHYDPARRLAWQYVYGRAAPAWVAGNTLCYRRSLWQRHRFADINNGEDTRFVWSLAPASVRTLPDRSFYVALIHPTNTSRKGTGDSHWHQVPTDEVLALMEDDYILYS